MASILDSSSLFRGMDLKKPGHWAAAERIESTILLRIQDREGYKQFPNVLLLEGKCIVKRQLYSRCFALRKTLTVKYSQCSGSLPYFTYSCTKHNPTLAPRKLHQTQPNFSPPEVIKLSISRDERSKLKGHTGSPSP